MLEQVPRFQEIICVKFHILGVKFSSEHFKFFIVIVCLRKIIVNNAIILGKLKKKKICGKFVSNSMYAQRKYT